SAAGTRSRSPPRAAWRWAQCRVAWLLGQEGDQLAVERLHRGPDAQLAGVRRLELLVDRRRHVGPFGRLGRGAPGSGCLEKLLAVGGQERYALVLGLQRLVAGHELARAGHP